MPTKKQLDGEWGEIQVCKKCSCPKCKKSKTFKRLVVNFKCVDVICDFCGYLAQVKTKGVKDIDTLPKSIPGAAWGPQKERMDAGIYFPLFIVLHIARKKLSIFYLPVDYQDPDIFIPRNPLKKTARRAGWQGFNYNLKKPIEDGIIRRLW
tara:strand:+ start:104 stop:556 length:453 start_codon:yes stop_codon:yes gene_type:complete